MISFQFLTDPVISSNAHPEIELLYVLHGTMRLRIGGSEYDYQRNDYCIINSGTVHELLDGKNLLLGEFRIQPDKLSDALGLPNPRFRCNSVLNDTPEKYESCREVMREIFSRYHNNRERDMLRMYSLYYRLLHLLTANFLQLDNSADTVDLASADSRTSEIAELIRQNYDKQLRLSDLADQMHLSVAYLSKYIKKNLGMSFLDYVTGVRLSHAVTALLHSNASVGRIAMDTGFANLSAFNKAFRERYQMTPTAYRHQYRSGTDLPAPRNNTQHVSNEPQELPVKPDDERNEIYLTVPMPHSEPEPLMPGWCKMINIGTASDLLRADVQQQVLFLHARLKYRYIRFWDLYDPEMLLSEPNDSGYYNFSRLDRVLDFLLKNEIKPYMELADKQRNVILRDYSSRSERHTFQTDSAYFSFLEQLIQHLFTRYGAQEVQQWYFEYWKTEKEEHPGVEDIRSYLSRFDRVAEILRSVVPEIRIGGGGFSLRFGEELLQQIVDLWQQHPQHPYFISLYCYPSINRTDRTAVLENQLVNPNSIKISLELLRGMLSKARLRYRELHVSEWNITIINRSVLNDSYLKGAYIVKNLIDTVGLADLYGYWLATDLFSEGSDTSSPLFGGCGLITRDGIPKPAWYAMEFLNELGEQLYQRGENFIITRDKTGVWRILCHNFKHFNYQYYLMEDSQIDLQQLEGMLSDTSVLNLHFELPALEGERCHVRRLRVGKNHGSVLDAWQRMGSPQQFQPAELDALFRASEAEITLSTLEEYGGTMQFQSRLDYNEFELILLSPQ